MITAIRQKAKTIKGALLKRATPPFYETTLLFPTVQTTALGGHIHRHPYRHSFLLNNRLRRGVYSKYLGIRASFRPPNHSSVFHAEVIVIWESLKCSLSRLIFIRFACGIKQFVDLFSINCRSLQDETKWNNWSIFSQIYLRTPNF